MRVDLLGPLPPPLGGVSVHVDRLRRRLREAQHEVRLLRLPGAGSPLSYVRELHESSRGTDLIHAHNTSPSVLMALAALGGARMRNTVLTVHAPRKLDRILRAGGCRRRALGWALRRVGAIIAVSEPIAQNLHALGVSPSRLFIAPAFLPPSRKRYCEQEPHPQAREIFEQCEPVICANAFRNWLHQGVPMYGHDMMVEMMARLTPEFPRLGLVVHTSLSVGDDVPRQRALERRTTSLGLAGRVAWIQGSAPFGPTLVRSRAMIRPTNTDGDAVSVREALHCGVPVLASDASLRPDGTVVLPSRDLDAWVSGVAKVLRAGRPVIRVQPDIVPTVLEAYATALNT